MRRWIRRLTIGVTAAVLASATGVAVLVAAARPAIRLRADRTKSSDNLRTLALLYTADGAGLGKPWPHASGKRAVLRVLAAAGIDRTNPQNLDVLFSPADASRSVAKAGGPAAFATLTLASLQDPSLDVDRFTSYAGPAGDGRPAPGATSPDGPALLADLSFGDVALVAFASGAVKTLTRTDLGLSDSDPLVVGPESKSPLLRTLSD